MVRATRRSGDEEQHRCVHGSARESLNCKFAEAKYPARCDEGGYEPDGDSHKLQKSA